MTNEWGMGKGAWKDSMPLGLDTQEFILQNPQWVLYMRRDTRFVCPHHRDPATLSAKLLDAPCTICFGTGVKVDPMIVPCRISLGQPRITHRETELRTMPGWLEYYVAAADFPRAVMPQNEDQILVCEWDKPSQVLGEYPRARVIRIANIYCIKQVNDYFERELSHYSVGLEAQNHDLGRLAMHLPVLRNVPIMNLDRNPLSDNGQWRAQNYW